MLLKVSSKKITIGVITLALVATPLVVPATSAYAEAKQKQVFCNIEGSSGRVKAQIGGPSTEHEYPLLVNGKTVFVQSESKVDSSLDAVCESLYGHKVTAHDDKDQTKTNDKDDTKKDEKGDTKTAGQGSVDKTTPAKAAEAAKKSDDTSLPAELPHTGINGIQGIAAALVAAAGTYGTAYVAQRKKQ